MYPGSIGWGFSARGHRPSTGVWKLAPRSGSPLTRPRGWWGFGDPSRSSSIGTGVFKPCRSWGRRCDISWSSLTLLLQKGFGGSETALRQWDFMVPSDFGLITLEWSRAHYSFLSWHKTPSKGPNWMFRCYTNLNLNLASALAITLRNRKTNSQPWAVCGTLFGRTQISFSKANLALAQVIASDGFHVQGCIMTIWWENCWKQLLITLWYPNMALEKAPCIDVFPNKTPFIEDFSIAMFDCRKVTSKCLVILWKECKV